MSRQLKIIAVIVFLGGLVIFLTQIDRSEYESPRSQEETLERSFQNEQKSQIDEKLNNERPETVQSDEFQKQILSERPDFSSKAKKIAKHSLAEEIANNEITDHVITLLLSDTGLILLSSLSAGQSPVKRSFIESLQKNLKRSEIKKAYTEKLSEMTTSGEKNHILATYRNPVVKDFYARFGLSFANKVRKVRRNAVSDSSTSLAIYHRIDDAHNFTNSIFSLISALQKKIFSERGVDTPSLKGFFSKKNIRKRLVHALRQALKDHKEPDLSYLASVIEGSFVGKNIEILTQVIIERISLN